MKIFVLFLFYIILITADNQTTLPQIIPPLKDDFYLPPKGFENANLGDILRFRKAPAPIKSIYFPVDIANTWQVLIRSQDVNEDPKAIMATIFEPHNANSSQLVAYQVAEDAASEDCAPSYAFIDGGGFGTIASKAEMFLIQTALDQGYYVVAPDYEGPNGAFTDGALSGYSTLDAIKAALNSGNITGIDNNAQVVLWGYSGGTIASGWAAFLQPNYAPSLTNNLIGCAIGGWVTNITSVAEAVDGTLFVGLTFNAIAGLTKSYGFLKDYIKSQIVLSKYNRFVDAYDYCLVTSILSYAYQNVFSGFNMYSSSGWNILKDDRVVKMLEANTIAEGNNTEIPEIPVFVYHGELDNIAPFAQAERAYDNWCDEGISSLEFSVSETTGHITEVIEGSGAALAWIKARFEGKEPVKGCKRTERITNLFYPGALGSVGDLLGAAVDNIFGFDIGPNGENIDVKGGEFVKRSY